MEPSNQEGKHNPRRRRRPRANAPAMRAEQNRKDRGKTSHRAETPANKTVPVQPKRMPKPKMAGARGKGSPARTGEKNGLLRGRRRMVDNDTAQMQSKSRPVRGLPEEIRARIASKIAHALKSHRMTVKQSAHPSKEEKPHSAPQKKPYRTRGRGRRANHPKG